MYFTWSYDAVGEDLLDGSRNQPEWADKWPVGRHLHRRVKRIDSDRHTFVIDDHPIVTNRLLERMSRVDPVIDQRTSSTCNHVALHKIKLFYFNNNQIRKQFHFVYFVAGFEDGQSRSGPLQGIRFRGSGQNPLKQRLQQPQIGENETLQRRRIWRQVSEEITLRS